jgi:hypothetical protein
MCMFEFMISPIVYYGADEWAFEHVYVIESVHLTFYWRIPKVNSSTKNVILYDEFG